MGACGGVWGAGFVLASGGSLVNGARRWTEGLGRSCYVAAQDNPIDGAVSPPARNHVVPTKHFREALKTQSVQRCTRTSCRGRQRRSACRPRSALAHGTDERSSCAPTVGPMTNPELRRRRTAADPSQRGDAHGTLHRSADRACAHRAGKIGPTRMPDHPSFRRRCELTSRPTRQPPLRRSRRDAADLRSTAPLGRGLQPTTAARRFARLRCLDRRRCTWRG